MERMERIMNDFKLNYPRCATFVENLNDKYSIKMKAELVINVSVFMAKLKRGDYTKHLKNKNEKIPDEVIDMLSTTYLQYNCKIIDEIALMFDVCETIPETLNSDHFMETVINQHCKN